MRVFNAIVCKLAGLIVALGVVALTVVISWYVFELRGGAMFAAGLVSDVVAAFIYFAADAQANRILRGEC